jgi:hypothetical protein
VVEEQIEQIERWELHSGTWLRDRASETWRFAATRDGTAADPKLPLQDLACLVGARRQTADGEWFPPEFNYSQQTGVPLRMPVLALNSTWVPPFGASVQSRANSVTGGLRQTPLMLQLARASERSETAPPDRTLPPLPPGQYRFVADKFDANCPILIAVEPEKGNVFALMPESKSWMTLERRAGASWAQRLRNPRGWRTELVYTDDHATAYCPCATGLAAITPSAIGLSYAVEYAGEAPAIGGPVAWGGEVWVPVQGKGHTVHLVGKVHGTARHIVLPTRGPAPPHGFEAPVFDDLHVNWPCDEGQLVLRQGPDGDKQCDWIAWPERVKPLFAMGCPYVSPTGTFWQLCRTKDDGRFEYVQMDRPEPEAEPTDGLRLCTGRVGYRGTLRIDAAPWAEAPPAEYESTEIVAPLLESTHDGAVVGLRMDAPHGVPALLHAKNEPRHAVLQVEVQGRTAVPFGTIDVTKPWLALPFVHDGHLWVDHPDLPQVAGWKLGQ